MSEKYYKYVEASNDDGKKVYLVAEVEGGSRPGTRTVATVYREEDAKAIADALNDANKTLGERMERTLNVFGGRENCDKFVEEMLCLHRTLNQKFTGSIVIPFVKAMADKYKEGGYDGRNETAAKYCSLFWEGLVKVHPELADGDWRLPLV